MLATRKILQSSGGRKPNSNLRGQTPNDDFRESSSENDDWRDFGSWLSGVARNKIKNFYYKSYRAEEFDNLTSDWIVDPCETAELSRRWDLFDRGVEAFRLRSTARIFSVFSICILQGKKPEEAARTLGQTRNSIYIALKKAKQMVRDTVADLSRVERRPTQGLLSPRQNQRNR